MNIEWLRMRLATPDVRCNFLSDSTLGFSYDFTQWDKGISLTRTFAVATVWTSRPSACRTSTAAACSLLCPFRELGARWWQVPLAVPVGQACGAVWSDACAFPIVVPYEVRLPFYAFAKSFLRLVLSCVVVTVVGDLPGKLWSLARLQELRPRIV